MMAMWRRAVLCALVVVILLVAVVQGDEKKSCVSVCHKHQHPHCGAWLQRDNSKEASGIYLLPEGSVNFTCSVNSLPEPAIIEWLFRPEHDTEWKTLDCSSLRSTKHCRFNEVGEHRVTSHCTMKMDKLTQSGAYRCAARSSKNEPNTEVSAEGLATSGDAFVKVFGIENITLVKEDLHYDRMGSVTVKTCANPKPDVIWVNARDDTAIQAGQTIGRLTALPLQAVSQRTGGNSQGPSELQPYCYHAKLFVSRVNVSDNHFLVTVSNQASTKSLRLLLGVEGVPKGSLNLRPILTLISFASLFSILFRVTNM